MHAGKSASCAQISGDHRRLLANQTKSFPDPNPKVSLQTTTGVNRTHNVHNLHSQATKTAVPTQLFINTNCIISQLR